MILIFSEYSDLTTRQVIRYLNYFDEKFEIFLDEDNIEIHHRFDKTNFFDVYKNNVLICSNNEIKSVWYRRGGARVTQLVANYGECLDSYNKSHVETRYEHIVYCLGQSKKCLGYIGKGNFNKFTFLSICNELGILIPKTIVTKLKSELIRFYEECNNNVITKSIGVPYDTMYKETEEEWLYHIGYTSQLTDNDIKNLPNVFDLSLFQEKIDKKYEIRVFYINGKCFSQVILSQLSEKSLIDYRLGYASAMRMSNFNLPKKVEKQVTSLMNKIGLNTGSLDLMVTNDNLYYFLEVNPSGQFGAVSELTNYSLEYEVAKYLISNN